MRSEGTWVSGWNPAVERGEWPWWLNQCFANFTDPVVCNVTSTVRHGDKDHTIDLFFRFQKECFFTYLQWLEIGLLRRAGRWPVFGLDAFECAIGLRQDDEGFDSGIVQGGVDAVGRGEGVSEGGVICYNGGGNMGGET